MVNWRYRKLGTKEIERAGEKQRRKEYKEINDYFHQRKTGSIKWKTTEEDLIKKYGKKLGKVAWQSEQERRKGYNKYIQKKRKDKYQKAKRLLDRQRKTKLEEWEVEYEDNRGITNKWKEFRQKYYKLVWNKSDRQLQWVETFYEKKISKTSWREV
ncbi:MAG: hypothetical protein MRERV_3c038 [Mycoplasmataceae bacterium RV_VA103A]|nr:MAG: hypothetical protein MRERV_3c038 [Mycoplasmataceae bacterium RV_VA103A]